MTWILFALVALVALFVFLKIGAKILAIIGSLFLLSSLAGVTIFLVMAIKRGSFGGMGMPGLIRLVGMLLPVCLLLLVFARKVLKLPKLLTVPLALLLVGGYIVLGLLFGGLQMMTVVLVALTGILVMFA